MVNKMLVNFGECLGKESTTMDYELQVQRAGVLGPFVGLASTDIVPLNNQWAIAPSFIHSFQNVCV